MQYLIQSSTWVEVVAWNDTITSYLIAKLLENVLKELRVLQQV